MDKLTLYRLKGELPEKKKFPQYEEDNYEYNQVINDFTSKLEKKFKDYQKKKYGNTKHLCIQ